MKDDVLVESAKLSQCSLGWHQLPPGFDKARNPLPVRQYNEPVKSTAARVEWGAEGQSKYQ